MNIYHDLINCLAKTKLIALYIDCGELATITESLLRSLYLTTFWLWHLYTRKFGGNCSQLSGGRIIKPLMIHYGGLNLRIAAVIYLYPHYMASWIRKKNPESVWSLPLSTLCILNKKTFLNLSDYFHHPMFPTRAQEWTILTNGWCFLCQWISILWTLFMVPLLLVSYLSYVIVL